MITQQHPLILLVEDHDSVRSALARLLRHEGYEVALADNGAQAFDQLRGGLRPCLILLDLTTPVMNGWEFRRRQLAEPELAGIPVVILTSAGNPVIAALEADGLPCLAEPL